MLLALAASVALTGMDYESNDTACVALTVWAEAKGESYAGQQMVAEVIRRRAVLRQKPPCQVVFELHQFYGIENWKPPRHLWKESLERWNATVVLVDELFSGVLEPAEDCVGALFFQTLDVPVPRGMEVACVIGGHKFLRETSNGVSHRSERRRISDSVGGVAARIVKDLAHQDPAEGRGHRTRAGGERTP